MKLRLSRSPQVVYPSGEVAALASPDASLLTWLALEGPTSRNRLAELIWPDSDSETARNALRQRLFRLHKAHGRDKVVFGDATLALAIGVAHDLVGSDSVLGDVPVENNVFGAWLAGQRETRHNRTRTGLVEQADAAESANEFVDAIGHARALLALVPLSEEAHRRVIRLHYLAGDRAASLLAFDRCERMLKDEVGTSPSAETLALLDTIEATATAPRADALASRQVPASVSRPPRVIGREPEFALLQQGWNAAQVIAVIGEAGIGKSRLLQAFASMQPGIVGASARPGDGGVPFATLARLLRAVAGSGDALHAPTRLALARVLPEWGEAPPRPAGEAQRLLLLRAVRELLASRADVQGVFVDDLHFADSASLDLLRSLVDDEPARGSDSGSTAASPRWLLAYRPIEAESPLHALHDGLVEQARLLPILLAPLDQAALAELVDSLGLPDVRGAALAAGLLRRTGGNPLFVLETLKQAWVERTLRQLAESMPRPLSVMRLIERRLSQLSPPALALARCAAVAGQDFSTALAAGVLGVHALALADAWAELEQANVLQDQAFSHDLYFEAALASVPAAIARHLHAEVADYLERHAANAAAPATLARHWLSARGHQRAIPYLERAAQVAKDSLDPALAAGFLGQLAESKLVLGDQDAAFVAAHDAADTLRSQGSGAALESAIDRLATLAQTPRQRAAAWEARAVMHHIRGDSTQAAECVAHGLCELGDDEDVASRVNLLNVHGIVLRRSGRLLEARQALEQGLVLARSAPAADDPGDLAGVLNNLALVLQETDDHLGASSLLQESAGRQTDPLIRARVLNNLAISLEERGQSALAYEQRLTAARLCAAAEAPGSADLMLAISLGANARNLARYRDALAHLGYAQQLLARDRNWREHDLHCQFAALWLELGRANLARQAIEAAESAPGSLESAPSTALARARYLIAVGQDPSAVLEQAEATWRREAEHRSLRRLLVCKAQVVPAEAALALMRELIESPALQDNAGAAIPAHVRMAQAWLRLDEPAPALRHAQRAADALGGALPLDMSRAEVWLTLARALQASGEPEAALNAAARGRSWLEQIAELHLDKPYRESYLNRNPVNAALLRLAPATAGPLSLS